MSDYLPQREIKLFKPIYKQKQLIIGNPAVSIGIVTLWSEREKLAAKIASDSYCVIGQLYSATRGLDPLVRNLLANPQIRILYLCGRDLSHSGLILKDFFEYGVESHTTPHGTDCWRVRSSHGEGYIDLEVDLNAIDFLRENITLVSCPNEKELAKKLKTREMSSPPWGESLLFDKKEVEIDFYPAEEAGFVLRDKTIVAAWLRILDTILRFGTVSDTHYDNRQKEIIDLVSVVEEEDPANLFVPEFLSCDMSHLKRYFPRVLTDEKFPDCSYTYGQRLRSYFEGVDQVKAMIRRLVKQSDSRSAVASLWDPVKDSAVFSGAPCLNHLWARISDKRLFLTAVIRSNDMFSAWPENAFALRKLQEEIRGEVAAKRGEIIKLGALVIISQSAHIYEDCWEPAQETVGRYYNKYIKRRNFDPRGHFVIEVSDCILVEHITLEGETLKVYAGKTAKEIRRHLTREGIVSSLDHALYLGEEMAKAEMAVKHPDRFEYIQDRPLIQR